MENEKTTEETPEVIMGHCMFDPPSTSQMQLPDGRVLFQPMYTTCRGTDYCHNLSPMENCQDAEGHIMPNLFVCANCGWFRPMPVERVDAKKKNNIFTFPGGGAYNRGN